MDNSFNENVLDTIASYYEQLDEADQVMILAMYGVNSLSEVPAVKYESLLSDVLLAACD